jgi:AbrB family looped-hinge helix DNA binding protein
VLLVMKKGKCMKEATVYGLSTVSGKGQIAIPVVIRRELDLKEGDKLLIIKRSDNAGFTFIKLDLMDKLMDKMQKDEKFFEKIS